MNKGQKEHLNDLEINRDRLDDEWIGQPRSFYNAARDLADADYAVDTAKSVLDVVQADLYKEIRSDPSKYGLEKPTEASINAVVITDIRYKQALHDLITCKHRKDICKAYVQAMDHRKSALERLVSLHGQQYFATPTAPEPDRERLREKERDHVFGSKQKKKKPK